MELGELYGENIDYAINKLMHISVYLIFVLKHFLLDLFFKFK